jgi:hypothetical protein
MSISAVAMMNGIAAARSRRAPKSLKRDCVTESGAGAGSGKRILNEAPRPVRVRSLIYERGSAVTASRCSFLRAAIIMRALPHQPHYGTSEKCIDALEQMFESTQGISL